MKKRRTTVLLKEKTLEMLEKRKKEIGQSMSGTIDVAVEELSEKHKEEKKKKR